MATEVSKTPAQAKKFSGYYVSSCMVTCLLARYSILVQGVWGEIFMFFFYDRPFPFQVSEQDLVEVGRGHDYTQRHGMDMKNLLLKVIYAQ